MEKSCNFNKFGTSQSAPYEGIPQDFAAYETAGPVRRDELVFDTIVAGLRDIATIDHLDRGLLESVIQRVAEHRLNTELIFYRGQNPHYEVAISYFAGDMESKSPFYLNVRQRESGRQARHGFGHADHIECHYRFARVKLLRHKLRIRKSNSSLAPVWVAEDAPSELEFNLADFIETYAVDPSESSGVFECESSPAVDRVNT